RVKDEGLIDPAYLAVFLASPLGQSQIKRLMSGISIFNIAKSELEKIKIIIGKNAEYVALKYRKVQGFLARFNVQYAYIEESLMKTIVMYETIKEKSFSFKIRISQVKKEDTLDPEFFKICDNVKNSILLGDIVEVKSGIEVGTASYRLNGRPFIRVGNITPCFLVNKDQKYISQELYDLYKNKYEPRLNDIILTKDGTPGMALVINESSKSIISSGMVRLVLKNKNFNPYYLALVLNSLIGQVKIKRLTGGSNIKHLKLSAIPKIEIPVMFNSFQEDIGNSLKDLLDL
ncbi:MAG: restriction endonuclease subunit S, partial [Candidatus Falkowbacteria bacterium]|nr:restriction endonuclease subunit S [Candidatus Falkowbacteria bacterium]